MIKLASNYYSWFGIFGLMRVVKRKATNSNSLLKVGRHRLKAPFYLRLGTSDIQTYEQVFINQDFDFVINVSPKVIVDAGANIGLASIYFANRYPESKIIAIEPEKSNFELLKMNVAPYDNIVAIQAALWDKNEEIDLVDPGLGKWGFMTEAAESQQTGFGSLCHRIQGVTIDKIMKDYDISSIDILKMDIEGAEREVFNDPSSWIGSVSTMIVELHERMKSGCRRSFYNNSNGFDIEWTQGERVYLSRGNSLSKPKKILGKMEI